MHAPPANYKRADVAYAYVNQSRAAGPVGMGIRRSGARARTTSWAIGIGNAYKGTQNTTFTNEKCL
jgi:hypothetical protein